MERNFFVRMDIGSWIIPFGDRMANSPDRGVFRVGTKHNFAMELGMGFRF